jgi:hypothetical protein
MPSLIPTGDGPTARCVICGAAAAGPCARCKRMVCGDCCELVQGAGTFAVCTRCAKQGTNLGWVVVLGWLALVIVGLAGIATLLYLARR